jgi:SHS2 domain-containing protein
MHEWREHTAEVELVIDAASPEEVFVEAAAAFAELAAGAGERGSEPQTREVRLEARDRASLLVDWLEELIYLADTDGFVPRGVQIQLADASLEGRVYGVVGSVDPLVKAATYHGLAFEEREGRWHAHVVLDV